MSSEGSLEAVTRVATVVGGTISTDDALGLQTISELRPLDLRMKVMTTNAQCSDLYDANLPLLHARKSPS